jgi:hypothetical protein
MKRSNLILMGLAAVAGLGLGLYYSWVLDPVEYYDASAEALAVEGMIVYLAIIGDQYADDGDLERARASLEELGLEADGALLAGFIESYLDGGGQPQEVRNLARLAETLGASGGVLLVFAPEPTPTPTPTPPSQPTVTPLPTVPATPMPNFLVSDKTAHCAGSGQPGQIQVWVQDGEGNDLPGIEVVVSWSTGQDRFFTGLHPAMGTGYADFDMTPNVEYTVALVDYKGEVVEDLTSAVPPGLCPTDTLALNWRVIFQEAE